MPPKQKKIPMRMCVGCREMKPKREMARIVRSPEGAIALDRVGRAPGRGAYICNDPECLKKAMKANLLAKAFECQVDKEVYLQLEQELSDAPDGGQGGRA